MTCSKLYLIFSVMKTCAAPCGMKIYNIKVQMQGKDDPLTREIPVFTK